MSSVTRNALEKIEDNMMITGEYKKGLDDLWDLLKKHPGESSIYIDLGIAYYGLMEYQKANAQLQYAKKNGADNEYRGLLKYMLVSMKENKSSLDKIQQMNKLSSQGRITPSDQISIEHIKVLDNLLREKHYYPIVLISHVFWIKKHITDFPGIDRLAGDVYYDAEYYKEAERSYKKALDSAPENNSLYKALADCSVATGDFDTAIMYYNKSIVFYKKTDSTDTGKEIEKITAIKQALPKKHEDIDKLVKENEYKKAKRLCKKKLSRNPDDYVTITQLGNIYWKTRKRRSAIKLFRKAIRLAPDYPIAHFYLGKAYVFEKKHEKGISEFNIFKKKMALLPRLAGDPLRDYFSNLHYIAYMYFTLKRYDKAQKECKKILSLNPDDQRAHYNMAICYYTYLRNRQGAYSELQKVINIDPNSYVAGRAKFFIDYIRRNPDPRFAKDFTFMLEDN